MATPFAVGRPPGGHRLAQVAFIGGLNVTHREHEGAPEARAREKIDALLVQAGWLVQDRDDMNLVAGDGITVREFKLEKGDGCVDYLLFVDRNERLLNFGLANRTI